MEKIKKILVINLGSTSSKIAYCENDRIIRQRNSIGEYQLAIIHLPFVRSAGHNEESDIIVRTEAGFQNLHQVVGRPPSVCFQVGAAVVEQDCPLRLRIRVC